MITFILGMLAGAALLAICIYCIIGWYLRAILEQIRSSKASTEADDIDKANRLKTLNKIHRSRMERLSYLRVQRAKAIREQSKRYSSKADKGSEGS